MPSRRRLGRRLGIGHPPGDRCRVLRAGPPGDHRRDLGAVEPDLAIEGGPGIARQRPPTRQRPVPVGTLRRVGPSFEIPERRLVRRHHAGARPGLDRHVAESEPPFHRQPRDRRAGIFDDMLGGAGGADPGDDRQDHVLCRNTSAEPSVDRDAHGAQRALPQRLGRQHVGHLGRADAEGERADGAMGRGMAVATDDEEAGLAQPLLRPDDVHDALARIVEAEQRHAVRCRVADELLDHEAALGIRNPGDVARAGQHIMIRRGKGALRRAQLDAALPQPVEGRRRAVMDEVAVDVEQGLAVIPLDDAVARPDLLEHGARRLAASVIHRFHPPAFFPHETGMSRLAASYSSRISEGGAIAASSFCRLQSCLAMLLAGISYRSRIPVTVHLIGFIRPVP